LAVYEVRPATDELLAEVASRPRSADVEELWAAGRLTPLEAVQMGQRFGEAYIGMVDGEPVCAFGVTPISALSGLGAPWMVGSTALDAHFRGFLRGCGPVVRAMLSQWPRLVNYVDARNLRAVKWLKWLGFSILPPVPYGHDGLPFHPFIKEA